MKTSPTVHPLKLAGILLGLLLACAAVGIARQKSHPKPNPPQKSSTAMREPEMRPINNRKDAAIVKRIEAKRALLPAAYRRRNNFAWASVQIDGLDKTEYFAHSGIQSLNKLSSKAAKKVKTISVRPQKGKARFKPLCVNQRGIIDGDDCWVRSVDTEFKILEDLAKRLKDPAVSGQVQLYTVLPPCPSCWGVMKQFLAAYPNVNMEVLYRKR